MRMPLANANPDNLRRTFGRKRSDAFNREKERAELDRIEFFTQLVLGFFPNIRKEAEREMHLIACGPTHTTNARVKIDKYLFDGRRQID